MLVKIGNIVSINMTSIERVGVIPHEEITVQGSWFQKKEVNKTIAVKVFYKDSNGHSTTYTLYGFKDYASAQKVYHEVLNQVKELENVGATQALEEALKNG